VQLFLEHGQRVQPKFKLNDLNRSSIVRICRQVEGVPLGIELAAGWLRILSCQEIADEVSQRNIDFWKSSLRHIPERHRSLRAVFDYSWDLLSDEEKRVFRQLSIFRGGFDRKAAHSVTGVELPTLLALVDKSLIRRSLNDRFDMHTLLQQYAAEHLDQIPVDKTEIQGRHFAYFSELIRQSAQKLEHGKRLEVVKEIGPEIHNFRAVWQWAVEQGKGQEIKDPLESLLRAKSLTLHNQGVAGITAVLCSLCGHRNAFGALFCEQCGHSLGKSSTSSLTTHNLVKESVISLVSGINDVWDLFLPSMALEFHILSKEHDDVITFDANSLSDFVATEKVIFLGRYSPFVDDSSPHVEPHSDASFAETDRILVDLSPYGAEDAGVSRRHVELRVRENHLFAVDLGSTNGTYLNGQRLEPNQPRILRDGDEMVLGKLAVRVRFV
jgi:hypothetical protein